MSEVTIESVEGTTVKMTVPRLQPLMVWFHFLNFANLAIVCMMCLKIYKTCRLVYGWLFPVRHVIENPTILVIGPKKAIVEELVVRLSERYNCDAVELHCDNVADDVADDVVDVPHGSAPAGNRKSRLLYSHAAITSHDRITSLSMDIEKTYGAVDVLVIAQTETRSDSTHSFLNHLNKELLEQFWTVMAFLPGMLRRNSGHIISISLGRTSLVNIGIMRTIYEDLLQGNTKVTLTLVERNTFLENFLPSIPPDTLANLIVRSMWNSNSIVKIPLMSSCLLLLPLLIVKAVMRPILKVVHFGCV